MDMSEKINGLVRTKVCKVSADADSKDAPKTVTLRINFNGVTLEDVFEKAIATVVIQWQTKARKIFNQIADKSTVDVEFTAPARTTVDPIAAFKAKFASASAEEREQLLAELMALQGK